ncbi:hypothetical protein Tco_0871554 [Tanacetum coccineum]
MRYSLPQNIQRKKVRSHHQDSEEAGVSKDISGDEGLRSEGTKLIQIVIKPEVTFTKLKQYTEGSDSVAIPFPLSALGVVTDDPLASVIRIALEEGVTSGIGTLVIIVVVVTGVGVTI